MGEAKRRKTKGLYPIIGKPEEFVAPNGTVSITIDVVGAPSQSTVMFDAIKIADVDREIRALMPPGLRYGSIVNWCAENFIGARRRNDDGPLVAIGLGILWTALNHPQLGDNNRRAISERLREDGKAHITWFYDPSKGLAMAVCESFVNLQEIMNQTPKDRILQFEAVADGDLEIVH